MRKLVLMVALASVAPLLAQSSSSYRITHTYTLGGDGSWDYIVPDPPNHRLFIGRQNRVMVVDEDNGTLLGEVTGIQGAHGTAVADATGHGFATSGNDQSVVMFDLKTFKVLGRIPAAEDADAIIYDSASNRVFTFNGDAHSSTVIDPRAGTLDHEHPARRQAGIRRVGRRRQGVRESHGHERGGRDRREDRDRDAALVHRAVQAAGRHGHRHRASSAVQRVPQRRDGDLRLSGRQGRGDGADRRRRRRRRVRRGLGRRVRVECGRHADGDSSGRARPVSRRPDRCRPPPAARNMGLDPTNHRVFLVSAKFGPAPAGGRGRGPVLPGSFTLMVIERAPAGR